MKKLLSVYLVFFLLIMNFSCCNRSKLQCHLEDLMNQELSVPLEKMVCLYSDIYTNQTNEHKVSQYMYIHYVDSSQCSPCALDKLYLWNDLILEFEKKGIHSCFIFEPKKGQVEGVYLSVKSSGFKSPVYVDTSYCFRKENSFIPNGILYHSFGINKKRKIVIIGNPLLNKKVKKLYDELVTNSNNLN